MPTAAAAYVKSQLRAKIHQVLCCCCCLCISLRWGVGIWRVEPCLSFLKYKIGHSRRVLETEVVNRPMVV